MSGVQILGPTPAERDLESAIEDALDARSAPYSPHAGLYVVDAETPAAIVRAMRELGWREPIKRHVCPVCKRDDVSITKSGVMRHHSGDIWEGGWRQVCRGAGLPPAGRGA